MGASIQKCDNKKEEDVNRIQKKERVGETQPVYNTIYTRVDSYYGKKKIEFQVKVAEGNVENGIAFEFYALYGVTRTRLFVYDPDYFTKDNIFTTTTFNGNKYYTGFDMQEIKSFANNIVFMNEQGTNDIAVCVNDEDYLRDDFHPTDATYSGTFLGAYNIAYSSDYPFTILDWYDTCTSLLRPMLLNHINEYEEDLKSYITTKENQIEHLESDIENNQVTINQLEEEIATLEQEITRQYEIGFEAGQSQAFNILNFVSSILLMVDSILSVEILPYIQLWYIVAIPIILSIVDFILKRFR